MLQAEAGPDHAGRLTRLTALLPPEGAAGLVVTDPLNIRYLCGFTGTFGALAVTAERAVLVTDDRYADQAARQSPDVDVVVDRVGAQRATRIVGDRGVVALEADHVTIAELERLRVALPDAELVARSGLVERLRRSKDSVERQHLATACAIISAAVTDLMAQIRVGLTERDVAIRLDRAVVDAGAQGPAFPTIVATGPNSAIPHHEPTAREISSGDLLKIDAGAVVAGYHSDMTRTFVVGAEPTARQVELYEAVESAAGRARALVTGGRPIADVVAAARSELAARSLDHLFPHGLGHGVGLAIHEDPLVSGSSGLTMEPGDVLTIEPGVYEPGFGGVRIEDTLAVTALGGDSLTTTSRDLVRLG